jgi:hypothetical protein
LKNINYGEIKNVKLLILISIFILLIVISIFSSNSFVRDARDELGQYIGNKITLLFISFGIIFLIIVFTTDSSSTKYNESPYHEFCEQYPLECEPPSYISSGQQPVNEFKDDSKYNGLLLLLWIFLAFMAFGIVLVIIKFFVNVKNYNEDIHSKTIYEVITIQCKNCNKISNKVRTEVKTGMCWNCKKGFIKTGSVPFKEYFYD